MSEAVTPENNAGNDTGNDAGVDSGNDAGVNAGNGAGVGAGSNSGTSAEKSAENSAENSAANTTLNTQAKQRLAELVKELAVVHGKVTLSSGKEADYYVDLRRATLHHEASPLIGQLLRDLTADLDFEAVGGLTLGADPVATAVMHADGRPIDSFVVRKEAKKHGMQRRIEGPSIVGKRVLVVEDTTTTGNSPLTAVEACRAEGAEVVAVATVVDRATGADHVLADAGLDYRFLLSLNDLGLA